MNIFLIICFVLCCIAECVCVPIFLKYQWPEKCWKSFRWKMICATLFVICGAIAIKLANNYTDYSSAIMTGLCFGWLGDLLLHIISKKKIFFIGGLFAFLAGHICYIVAFQRALEVTYPDARVVEWYEVLLVLAFVGALVFVALKKKLDVKNPIAVPVVLYAGTITYMLAKAFRLCIGVWGYGTFDHTFLLFLTVGLGAVMFFLSDATLGIIEAGMKNKKLKWFNIGTYFLAQVLLASSMFIVYGN